MQERKPPEHRCEKATIYTSVSVAPPPCRMLLVVAYGDDETKEGADVWHVQYYPVVGVRSSVFTQYFKWVHREADSPPTRATHDDLIKAGYHVDILGSHVEDDLLVIANVDGSDHVYELGDAVEHCRGYRVVPCHWTADNDREHAAEIGKRIVNDPPHCGSTGQDNEIVIKAVSPEDPSSCQ